MINAKRINVISVILIIIALISSLLIWIYSLNNEFDSYIYNNGVKVTYTDDDNYNASTLKQATEITGQNSKVSTKGGGVYIDGKTVSITSGGYYKISGNIENIVVRSPDSRPVNLVLDNAYIESSAEPPIYIYRATQCIISSAEGSDSYIIDNRKKYSNQNTSAAVYSVSDVTVNGAGKIHIEGNYQDGIYSSKNIKVMSGELDITSKDEGLNGDAVFLQNGIIAINSEGDAVKADAQQNKGTVAVNNETSLKIRSLKDGIYSTGDIYIENGELNIFTGSGAENSQKQASKNLMPPGTPPEMMPEKDDNESDNIPSMKGLKADGDIYINDGSLLFDSDDDAVHSSNIINVKGGIIAIATGDDGIRADERLIIDDGKITITNCYEGLESKYIEINGGDINITAIDDGINVSGSDMFAMMPPMDGEAGGAPPKPPGEGGQGGGQPPGQENTGEPNNNGMPQAPPKMNIADDETTEMSFVMNDGNIYIEALGDGVDINGSCEMNGGKIVSFAKTDGPDLAFDFDGVFRMNGGVFMGTGNANMIEEPSEKSKANCLMAYTPVTYRNGGHVEILDPTGQTVAEMETDGSFCWIGWYGDDVKDNETYTALVDGEVIGEGTVTSVNTVIGKENANRNAPPGMGGGGAPPPPPGGPGGQPPQGTEENGGPPPPPPGGRPGGQSPQGLGRDGGVSPPNNISGGRSQEGSENTSGASVLQNSPNGQEFRNTQFILFNGISAEMNTVILLCGIVLLMIICMLIVKSIKRRY